MTAPAIRPRSKCSATAPTATCASSKGCPEPRAGVSVEHPLAPQIDDLARLVDREIHRIVAGGGGVGADKAVLLAFAAGVARDYAGGLIMAVVLVRRGADDKALVFDRVGDLCGCGSFAAPEQRAEKGHCRSPVFVFFACLTLPRNATPRRCTMHPLHGVLRCRKPIG